MEATARMATLVAIVPTSNPFTQMSEFTNAEPDPLTRDTRLDRRESGWSARG